MNNLQTIIDLCGILRDLASVVEGLYGMLSQFDTMAMTDEYNAVRARYTALMGDGEWPEDRRLEHDCTGGNQQSAGIEAQSL